MLSKACFTKASGDSVGNPSPLILAENNGFFRLHRFVS